MHIPHTTCHVICPFQTDKLILGVPEVVLKMLNVVDGFQLLMVSATISRPTLTHASVSQVQQEYYASACLLHRLLPILKFLSHFAVYTDPWIVCPIDRVEELEPDASTVVLGYKWQLPRTNMKIVTVSPSKYNENYGFPTGRHRVTWIGTADSGAQKSCSFHITVNGGLGRFQSF